MPFLRQEGDTTLGETLGGLGAQLNDALNPMNRIRAYDMMAQMQQRQFEAQHAQALANAFDNAGNAYANANPQQLPPAALAVEVAKIKAGNPSMTSDIVAGLTAVDTMQSRLAAAGLIDATHPEWNPAQRMSAYADVVSGRKNLSEVEDEFSNAGIATTKLSTLQSGEDAINRATAGTTDPTTAALAAVAKTALAGGNYGDAATNVARVGAMNAGNVGGDLSDPLVRAQVQDLRNKQMIAGMSPGAGEAPTIELGPQYRAQTLSDKIAEANAAPQPLSNWRPGSNYQPTWGGGIFNPSAPLPSTIGLPPGGGSPPPPTGQTAPIPQPPAPVAQPPAPAPLPTGQAPPQTPQAPPPAAAPPPATAQTPPPTPAPAPGVVSMQQAGPPLQYVRNYESERTAADENTKVRNAYIQKDIESGTAAATTLRTVEAMQALVPQLDNQGVLGQLSSAISQRLQSEFHLTATESQSARNAFDALKNQLIASIRTDDGVTRLAKPELDFFDITLPSAPQGAEALNYNLKWLAAKAQRLIDVGNRANETGLSAPGGNVDNDAYHNYITWKNAQLDPLRNRTDPIFGQNQPSSTPGGVSHFENGRLVPGFRPGLAPPAAPAALPTQASR